MLRQRRIRPSSRPARRSSPRSDCASSQRREPLFARPPGQRYSGLDPVIAAILRCPRRRTVRSRPSLSSSRTRCVDGVTKGLGCAP
jgi:hypothetical protein